MNTTNDKKFKRIERIPKHRWSEVQGIQYFRILSHQQHLELFYSAQYTHASQANNNPIPLIPPLKQNMSVSYQKRNFKLQTEMEYASAQNRNSEEAGELATPSYWLINLRMQHSFELDKSSLTIATGVENMLNTAYRDHMDWGGILRPGRNI